MTKQFSLLFIQRFKGKVLFNIPMSDYTSLGVGGAADVMAFPKDEGDLKDLLNFASSKNYSVYLHGGGTNVIVRDKGIRGVVINMCEGFKDIVWNPDNTVIAGASVGLHELLKGCKERELTGFEFTSGIPGTVGGAVRMNAGAYGAEMKDIVEGAEIITKKGKRGFLTKTELGFGYRKSEMPEGAVIVRGHFKFEKSDKKIIEERIREFKERRRGTSAINKPNCGSVFKNPEGHHAGKLIEEAGLKGLVSGKAQISEIHANYIVNLGGAKAKDVLSLMATVRDKIYSEKGITLEPEVKVIGDG